MDTIILDGQTLSIGAVAHAARSWLRPSEVAISLSDSARARVQRGHEAVQHLVLRGEVVYGVTTGFGRFKDRVIPPQQAQQLQRNLLASHAVGVGDPLDPDVVRAAMVIRANTLAKGYSGISPSVLDTLIDMVNRGVYPVIPCKGSVGASGDLAPLAHMALVLLGEGEAVVNSQRLPGSAALQLAGIAPATLGPKEGLALLNGTSIMAALGCLAVHDAQKLCLLADVAGAMTLEALEGSLDAFEHRLHALRPHPHQAACAARVRQLAAGSEFARSRDAARVQDAYSLRCIPQVHGAVADALAYAHTVVERELNAAVDNPLVFWEDGPPFALSGGNFHGEPLALALDFLAVAMAELGSISERRVARLVDPALSEGLPAFLIGAGGLNSGFMVMQYTAAALVSENKVLAHPASVDSIPTSANTEDHVSMGTIAARQAREIISNVMDVLTIELIAAAQAIDIRQEGGHRQLGHGTNVAYKAVRDRAPFVAADQILYPHLRSVRGLIESGELAAQLTTFLAAGQPQADGDSGE